VRAALELIARGADAPGAAAESLALLQRRLGATAGIILLDPRGQVGMARTTESMPAAYRSATGATVVLD